MSKYSLDETVHYLCGFTLGDDFIYRVITCVVKDIYTDSADGSTYKVYSALVGHEDVFEEVLYSDFLEAESDAVILNRWINHE